MRAILRLILVVSILSTCAMADIRYYWDTGSEKLDIRGKQAIRTSKLFVEGKLSPRQLKIVLSQETGKKLPKNMQFRKFYECVDGLCVAQTGTYYGRSPL